MTRQRSSTLYREVDVPRDLASAIILRIAHARRRAARLHLAALGVGLAASAGALIPALYYAASEFYTSGFAEYLSLISVDGFAHWQVVALSLIDALPSLALLCVFASIAGLAYSLRQFVRSARTALPLFA